MCKICVSILNLTSCTTTCSFHVFLTCSFSQNRVGFRAHVLRVEPLHNLMQATRIMCMWMGVVVVVVVSVVSQRTMVKPTNFELNGKLRFTVLIRKHQHIQVHPVFHFGTKHYHQDSRSKISTVRSPSDGSRIPFFGKTCDGILEGGAFMSIPTYPKYQCQPRVIVFLLRSVSYQFKFIFILW